MVISANAQGLEIVTIEQAAYFNVLKFPAQPVSFPLNEEDKKLIEEMKIKLYELGGVGLAAPQVNQSRKIAAIYIPQEASLLRDDVQPYPMHIIINPAYEGIEEKGIQHDLEGCYSVSSKAGKVPRYKQIKLSFTDETGQLHQSIEEGFYARVLQHEIDHLNGILITDRLTPDCVQGTMEEMLALRRSELSDEQKEMFDEVMKKKKLKR